MLLDNKTLTEDSSFLMIRRRPKLLNILLLLSSIFILSTLTSVTQRLIDGPMTQIQLEAEMINLYQTPTILKAKGFNEGAIQSIQLIVENSTYLNNEAFYLSNITLLLTMVVGLVSIFLMFFMIKSGFYIYIIYSVLPIVAMYLTTPSYLILNDSVILLAISALIFTALYCISYRDVIIKR